MSSLEVRFTREQIARYAVASGDLNPIHIDPERARQAGLDDVIAHGMLQMGLAARLAGGRPLRRLRVRFAGMVRPGDTVTFSARLEAGLMRLEAVNQDGEAVLTRAEAELASEEPSDPAAAAGGEV
ncbi:MAG TPA: MaoC family dehydratase [Candidatus Nitrosotalea sp.]|nr:MaoC family dehydratase [Candidatus Nitrosotalea sp.]